MGSGASKSKNAQAHKAVEKPAAKPVIQEEFKGKNPLLASFPEHIIDAKGMAFPTSKLHGKFLGFYFAASWCPSCRPFSPTLAKWFINFTKNHDNADDLELIYMSSDRDVESFKGYHGALGFPALPFDQREIRNQLANKLGVAGLPSLVFVTPNGTVISSSGRKIVTEDPQAEGFPWTPKPFSDIFGNSFINNKQDVFTADVFKGKTIGLYFSAMWCPLCRQFTPQLVNLYKKLRSEGKQFEILFVSSDRDDSAYLEYFANMPWYGLDVDASKQRMEIGEHFKVKGIPSLVILDPDFKVITTDGRRVVQSDLKGANFPWHPKPYNPFNGAAMSVINDFPFLLVQTDGSKDKVHDATVALKSVAETEFAKAEPKLRFFYVANPDEDVVEQTQSTANLTPQEAIVIIDIQSGKKYVSPTQDLTESSVNSFVASYFDGKLEGIEF